MLFLWTITDLNLASSRHGFHYSSLKDELDLFLHNLQPHIVPTQLAFQVHSSFGGQSLLAFWRQSFSQVLVEHKYELSTKYILQSVVVCASAKLLPRPRHTRHEHIYFVYQVNEVIT